MQELLEKANDPAAPAGVQWRFIGRVQSNKVNKLAKCPNLAAVETVTSAKLATKLDAAWAPDARPLAVYVQVNTSGEAAKGGVESADEAAALARHIAEDCPRLRLAGLMTIGAVGDAGCFGALAEARAAAAAACAVEPDALELSMGMSGDFEAAIAAGSTSVRVGSTIFGERDY